MPCTHLHYAVRSQKHQGKKKTSSKQHFALTREKKRNDGQNLSLAEHRIDDFFRPSHPILTHAVSFIEKAHKFEGSVCAINVHPALANA